LPVTEAKRSGQADRSGKSGISPDYDNPARTHAEESQAECNGQAKRSGEGGSAVSPGYGIIHQAHAQKKTKRSGQAERS
jgi:hypothetical protein